MNRIFLLLVLLAHSSISLALSNRHRAFNRPCDAVWKAAVTVAKTQDYRIVSISTEEQIISLAVGGALSGERLVSISLAPGKEGGCTATVQSRFSGLAHSDGPDLLSRVSVELIGQEIDRDSKEFRRFKSCVESPTSDSKCEARLQKDLAAKSAKAKVEPQSSPDKGWWQISPPEEKKQ